MSDLTDSIEPSPQARAVAADVLAEFERALPPARQLLHAALQNCGLRRNKRGHVTDLVMGVLRWRNRLDWMLHAADGLAGPLTAEEGEVPFAEAVRAREMPEAEAYLRAAERIAAYEIALRGRCNPDTAAQAAVQLAAQRGLETTAMERRLQALAQRWDSIAFPSLTEDPVGHIATVHSHPAWLVRRWIDRCGLEETLHLCAANNEPVLRSLRVNTLRTTPAELQARLEERGLKVVPGDYLPEALRLLSPGISSSLAEYAEGLFTHQDEAAMAVSHLVDPQPGEHVLDLCAAPGGKTTHLAELMRDTGRIVAADVNARRLGQLLHTRTRLALSSIDVVGLDARVPALRPLAGFDRVLVDAPCSGLGTLRRHVDVRWRRTPAELERLPCLQLDLLRSGARQVRPGGVLVYATCTLEPTENEEVIAAFLAEEGTHFEVENAAEFLPLSLQAAVTPAGFVQTWPHRQQMDGFFMARLRRR